MKALNYILNATALAAVMTLTSCETLMMSAGTTTASGYDVYGGGYGGYDTYAYGTSSSWRDNGAAFAYDRARTEALFLSDKMAYELGLTDAQFEAVYEINLDYLLNISSAEHLYSTFWARRNSDLFYVLNARQYNYYMSAEYFYRPVTWYNNAYAFSIYDRYYDRSYYYRSRPTIYNSYRGGHNNTSVSYYKGRFGERAGNPPTVTNRTTTPTTTTQPRTTNPSITTPRSFGNADQKTNTTQPSSTQKFGNRDNQATKTNTTITTPTHSTITTPTHSTITTQPPSTKTFGNRSNQATKSTTTTQQKTTTVERSTTVTEKRSVTETQQKTETKKFGGRR